MLCRGEDGERQLMSKVLFSGPSQGYICATRLHQGHQHTCDPEKHWKLYYSHKWSDLREEYKKRIKLSRGSSPAVPQDFILFSPLLAFSPQGSCLRPTEPGAAGGVFLLKGSSSSPLLILSMYSVESLDTTVGVISEDVVRLMQTTSAAVSFVFLGVYVHKLWPELLFTEN